MRRMYCDGCELEIRADEPVYNVRISTGNDDAVLFLELCRKCENAIEKAVNKLGTQPLDKSVASS